MIRSATDSVARPSRTLLDAPRADELGTLARRGTAWSVLLIVSRQTIGLAATAVLARLLTPDDYGLIGMAAILTAFLQAFSEMGLSWATVQRKELTLAQVDNLFWVNTAVGALLWGVSILAAPTLAAFFGRAELAGLAAAMGAAFAINGMAVQPVALLTRRMEFRALFWVEAVAIASGTTVAVGMALRGYGYWALVGQALAAPLGRLVAVLANGHYRPGPPRSGAGTWGLIQFGGYLTAYTLVNYLGRNLDNILIGKVWGPEALGYYVRAYFLMSVPTLVTTNVLASVMVPSLSALKHDPTRMARAYRDVVRSVALIGLPAGAVLFVAAPEAVRLLYGPRWAAVAPLLRWLSIAAMTQVVVSTSGWLYIIIGRSRAMLLVGLAATSVQAAAFVIGNRWGPEGVAIAYAIANVALAVPTLLAAHRVAALRLEDTLLAARPALMATAFAITAALGAGEAVARVSDAWGWLLIAKVSAGGFAFVACGAALLRHADGGPPALMPRCVGGRA